MSAVIDTQDAVILGRRSYDEWAQFWPESTIEPYATFINAVAKFVVTSTPLDREWANARVVEDGLIEFVRELQDQPGGDIGVHASISVAQALLAAGVGSLTDCRPSGSNRSEARRRQLGNCSWITASFVSRRSRGHKYSRRVATDAEALHRLRRTGIIG